ncbi:MAG: RNA polymerase sigma factor [Planctomycetota bacterium]
MPHTERKAPAATPPSAAASRAPHTDPSSWGKLVESLDVANIFVAIRGWLSPRLRSEASPEDIWQEALWCSWRDREQHTWQNVAAWRAWLLSIARNRIRDLGRSAARAKRGGDCNTETFSSWSSDSIASMLPPGSTTPSRIAGLQERAQAMESALESLDDRSKTIVRMRLFEEVPMRQIAAELALPLSTAKEQFLRGVQRYRQQLGKLLGGDLTGISQ